MPSNLSGIPQAQKNPCNRINITHALNGSVEVVVTLKSKMAAVMRFWISLPDLSASSNNSPEPLLDGQAKSEHMSAVLHINFPLRRNLLKYNGLGLLGLRSITIVKVVNSRDLFEVYTDLAHSSCRHSTECSQQISLHSWGRLEHKHAGSSQ